MSYQGESDTSLWDFASGKHRGYKHKNNWLIILHSVFTLALLAENQVNILTVNP